MKTKLSSDALDNLRESGLTDETIKAMRVRMATMEDGIRTNSSGYVIPYFKPEEKANKYRLIQSGSSPFKRIRFLGSLNGEQKYLQSSGTSNHIYFPPVPEASEWFDTEKPLVITEGEKKAAAACQEDILCCAVSGVDSWRSRSITIDIQRVRTLSQSEVSIRLTEEESHQIEQQIAEELLLIPFEGREVYICYDRDLSVASQDNVQRAAFDLALWVESVGGTPKQVFLPSDQDKIGLDDFLMEYGPDGFWKVASRAQFPFRPKVKGWIQAQLSKQRRNRTVYVNVARAILSSLDRRGIRYADSYGNYYFFDKLTDILHNIPVGPIRGRASTFQKLITHDFGISLADNETVQRLMDDIQALPPTAQIERAHVSSYAKYDAFYYQLSDSRMARVTALSTDILNNGSDGVLFEAGAAPIELVDPPEIKDFNWLKVLETTALEPMTPLTLEETRVLAACLFYLSPWLRHWRGLMLPAEVALGEAGSGKSTLYQLRRGIYSGTARLHQPPDGLKDWYASIANESGLWVGDNMGHRLDDKFSNEIARMITDPEPSFELRELYTTSDVSRKYVDCVFAFTSIYNPISKTDLLQRSFQFNFHNIEGADKDGLWLDRQLVGRREVWVAHHLDVIQKFLDIARSVDWSSKSLHRLVHLEQSLRVIGTILGKQAEINSALSKLPLVATLQISEADPVMEGLKQYADHLREGCAVGYRFVARDIVEWVTYEDDSGLAGRTGIRTLQSARSIGKYIQSHAANVKDSVGIVRLDTKLNNKVLYELVW